MIITKEKTAIWKTPQCNGVKCYARTISANS